MKRFDIVIADFLAHESDRVYHSNGEFVEAEVAQDLLEALAYLLGDVKEFNDLEEEDSARLYAGSVFRAEQAISKAKGGDHER